MAGKIKKGIVLIAMWNIAKSAVAGQFQGNAEDWAGLIVAGMKDKYEDDGLANLDWSDLLDVIIELLPILIKILEALGVIT